MKKMKAFGYLLLMAGISFSTETFAQKTCTYTTNGTSAGTLSSNTTLSSLNSTSNWLATGGATQAECVAMAGGTTFTGNVNIDLANNKTLTINTNLTINGTFDLSSGPGAVLEISGGSTLHVTGDLGDPVNNGVQYNVVTSSDHIIADGTLYGKNNNSFVGSGSISGGILNVANGAMCSSPCPVTGGFQQCFSNGNTTSGAGAFCAASGAVPVKLISFEGKATNDRVILNWTTASEINFDYFSLQRSEDGKTFSELTQLKGHGTTNEIHNYSYEDKDPIIGRSYYRLTSNDFDGYKEAFPAISVEYHGEKKFTISPNPSEGVLVNLNFNFRLEEEGIVTIYDNVGSIVGNYPVTNGAITFANPLKSGVYLAKYSSSSVTKTDRFIVK